MPNWLTAIVAWAAFGYCIGDFVFRVQRKRQRKPERQK